MTSLIKETSASRLTSERLQDVLSQIKSRLVGRVEAAYIFGSASTGEISDTSDIDLILIQTAPDKPFIQRAFEFADLFAIFPNLDILVYTPDELAQQLADSEIGFWKSVRLSMKRIL